ncbi:MAG: universal stress protein UspA [Gammaproteobacteria bacterium]|nr:MAG: universal stress protein UspA [Gammaproteobacteria bacterium]
MTIYTKVLVAIDLTDESELVVKRASQLVRPEGEILALHVLEPIDSVYTGEAFGATAMQINGIQEDLVSQAKLRLAGFSAKYQIPKENQKLLLGRPAKEIRDYATSQDAEVIIIGTHGKHGFELLLGSTANGVLHGAPCDVLAVRIPKKPK